MNQAFYDAHCHSDHPDVTRPWAPAHLAGADPAHWDRVESVAHDIGAHFSLGIHPWFVGPQWRRQLDSLDGRRMDGHGEIGLDRHHPHRELQHTVMCAQLDRARLPVVLHAVGGHEALLSALKRSDVRSGLVHGWTGSLELAKRYVARGLCISFGPRSLRAPKARAAAEWCPSSHLLIETDGEADRDGPLLAEVADTLARWRNVDPAELGRQTAANARRLFPRMLPSL